MIITNLTATDYWFGPMRLLAGSGQTLYLDDTSDTSLYLLNDEVADAVNTLYLASPEPTAKGKPQEKTKPATSRTNAVVVGDQSATTGVYPTGGSTSLGPSAGGGEGIVVLGNKTPSLGIGGRARDAMIGVAAAVNHGDLSMRSKAAG